MITEFSLKYYNKNLYKNVDLNLFPELISKLKKEKLETQKQLENGGQPFKSYDHYADAKAYHYQAVEKYNLAKDTYRTQLETTLYQIEIIITDNPTLYSDVQFAIKRFTDLCNAIDNL